LKFIISYLKVNITSKEVPKATKQKRKSKKEREVFDDMQPKINHNDENDEEDEIDKILKNIEKSPKVVKEKKKSYKKQVEAVNEEKQNFPIKSIPRLINLEEVSSNPDISNTNIILSIMEIALNASDYQISYLNKSNKFWEEVNKMEKYKRVFGLFKAETLRKYWRMINELGNYEPILEVLQKNKKIIDNKDFK